jgi:hypothetical protein
MTPKEKAKELVVKYEPLLYQGYGDLDGYQVAKDCALICVDEMISVMETSFYMDSEYLEEVKQEINKL